MMHQPVDGSHCHHFIREDAVPLREGLIGGNDDAAGLIAVRNEFEEDIGLLVSLFDSHINQLAGLVR